MPNRNPHEFRFYRDYPGECRVYYKRGRDLFCIQPCGPAGAIELEFLTCTRDGEPCSPFRAFPHPSRFDRFVIPQMCGVPSQPIEARTRRD